MLIFSSLVFTTIKLNLKIISYLTISILLFCVSFELLSFGSQFFLHLKLANLNLHIDILLVLIAAISIILLTIRLKLNIVIIFVLIIAILPSRFILEFSYNNVIEPYQRNRIESFVNPEKDPDLSWNRKQSIIAVGSGRFAGKGFLKGTQTNYRFLPFSFTDFAFAALAEQFGLRGMLILLLIYFLFFIRIYNISKNSKDQFARLIAYGVMCMMFFNFFQHSGMNLGILPITGVPLPLISYGGSYLISTFIGLGLVMAVNNNLELRRSKVYRVSKKQN
jgi:rod shape determining protein RodA